MPGPMATEQLGDSTGQEVRSTIGNASFVNGKWFCDCRVAARCRTATKNSAHQGEKCKISVPNFHPETQVVLTRRQSLAVCKCRRQAVFFLSLGSA